MYHTYIYIYIYRERERDVYTCHHSIPCTMMFTHSQILKRVRVCKGVQVYIVFSNNVHATLRSTTVCNR